MRQNKNIINNSIIIKYKLNTTSVEYTYRTFNRGDIFKIHINDNKTLKVYTSENEFLFNIYSGIYYKLPNTDFIEFQSDNREYHIINILELCKHQI